LERRADIFMMKPSPVAKCNRKEAHMEGRADIFNDETFS
jgi:hypothetical protein